MAYSCAKNVSSNRKFRGSFDESDQYTFWETACTSDFNHIGNDNINCISADLLAQIMRTQNVIITVIESVLVDLNLGLSFRYCSNTNIIFSSTLQDR